MNWLPFGGATCPVDGDAQVAVIYADGCEVGPVRADTLDWGLGSTIARYALPAGVPACGRCEDAGVVKTAGGGQWPCPDCNGGATAGVPGTVNDQQEKNHG